MSNPFLTAVNKYKLIEKNDSVAVALSGGADSVSLLHMLCSVKEKYNLICNNIIDTKRRKDQ